MDWKKARLSELYCVAYADDMATPVDRHQALEEIRRRMQQKAREYIGNAVPPAAAEAMGNVILLAIAQAEAGVTFEMSWYDVWVRPAEVREIQLVQ